MSKSVHEPRPGCPARYHDTYSAYQRAGCRCPKAREDLRLYSKRQRTGRPDMRRINACGTQRRIHALWALGHSSTTIGRHAGMSSFEVQQIANSRRYVTPDTAAVISDVYETLSGTVGTSTITRQRAEAAGYPPPLAWDDDTIDDPSAVPNVAGTGTVDSDDVDDVAVELACQSEIPWGRLRHPDRMEAARTLLGRGLPLTRVSTLLQVQHRFFLGWLARHLPTEGEVAA